MNEPELAPHHREMLEVHSGISPEVIREARVFTANTKAELSQLGFKNSKAPALVFPVLTWSDPDSPAYHRLRPDTPRVSNGKPVKYEQPPKVKCRLYCLPGVRRKITEFQRQGQGKDEYVFITEGEKKAMSGLSQGLAVLSLPGVWNFKGLEMLRADFDVIGFKEMKVCIVFDSDAVTNRHVKNAEDRLAQMLQSYGAEVSICRLPPGPGGNKQGLDDFFVNGGTIEGLLDCIQPYSMPVLQDDGIYRVNGGRFERLAPKRSKSDQDTWLAVTENFTVYIDKEIVVDSGAQEVRLLELVGQVNGEPLRRISVPAASLANTNWIITNWGTRLRMPVGMCAERHFIEAMKAKSSPDIEHRIAHTGWKKIDGEWTYFHNGGGINQFGVPQGIGSQFDRLLTSYEFELLEDPELILECIQGSLNFMKIAPGHIIAPLWCSIWRAIIGDAAFSLFLVGPTGSRKSSVAAAILGHFGAQLAEKEEAGIQWSSTANAIESAAFYAKDALLVVDDFVPRGSVTERANLQKTASRILRSAGNRSGRSRLNSDLVHQHDRPPRCLILATGEETPEGRSELARTLVLEVTRTDVNNEALADYQQLGRTGKLSSCTASFIQWLAPRLDKIRSDLLANRQRHQDGTRTSEQEAELQFSAEVFMDFAVEKGLLKDQADSFLDFISRGLAEAIHRQSEHLKDQDPHDRFCELLVSGFDSGRFYVLDIRTGHLAPGLGRREGDRLMGTMIGWSCDEELYLIPDQAYSAIKKFGEESGKPIQLGPKQLTKLQAERGVLTSNEGRHTRKIRVPEGGQKNVLCYSRRSLGLEIEITETSENNDESRD